MIHAVQIAFITRVMRNQQGIILLPPCRLPYSLYEKKNGHKNFAQKVYIFFSWTNKDNWKVSSSCVLWHILYGILFFKYKGDFWNFFFKSTFWTLLHRPTPPRGKEYFLSITVMSEHKIEYISCNISTDTCLSSTGPMFLFLSSLPLLT
jgi:hypothetical protein